MPVDDTHTPRVLRSVRHATGHHYLTLRLPHLTDDGIQKAALR